MGPMRSFDLIIVGSGSGNSLLTDEYRDLDVAIVEPGRFGGTCLNVGCIATKMYVSPATVADPARDAHACTSRTCPARSCRGCTPRTR